jgi:uridylate kinase
LLSTIFRNYAKPRIVKDPNKQVNMSKPLLIASGWKPGFSTDYDAVLLARTYGAKRILNLTDVDYVYDKDPDKYKSAKRFTELSWRRFRKIVGNKWSPGLKAPFDPVASRLAQKLGVEVVILKGNKIKNLKNCIENKPFKGTIIKSKFGFLPF